MGKKKREHVVFDQMRKQLLIHQLPKLHLLRFKTCCLQSLVLGIKAVGMKDTLRMMTEYVTSWLRF